jgi:hypothetical protein
MTFCVRDFACALLLSLFLLPFASASVLGPWGGHDISMLYAPALQPVRSDYQPPASSTFLSEQISHQQSGSSTFLSEQISTSHQPPQTNRLLDWTTGLDVLLGAIIPVSNMTWDSKRATWLL